ncbi:MAG TPA: homocysteine S-methyltransferase family protein [Anaerolineae bacterium]
MSLLSSESGEWPVIILDGAMGTELTRCGVETGLPLWSADALLHAPEVVRQIHADYIAAGAQVITTDTFRTNVRTLERAGIRSRQHELTSRAVQLAHEAVAQSGRRQVLVAGSIAPVEDCYSPELAPLDHEVLYREHAVLAGELADAGCNLLLIETMGTVREAVEATRAACGTRLPVWVSLMVGADHRLLSGETIEQAVHAILPFAPQALLLNCLPVAQAGAALALVQQAAGAGAAIRFGVYANAGHIEEAGWSAEHTVSPVEYALASIGWRAQGASVIGGCCGTTPEHIRQLVEALRE